MLTVTIVVRGTRDRGQRMREVTRLDELADHEPVGQQRSEATPAQWLMVGDDDARNVHKDPLVELKPSDAHQLVERDINSIY